MNKSYTWDLSELYSGPNDPQLEKDLKHAESVVATFADKWVDRSDYLTDAAVLREALDEYEELNREVGTGSRATYFLELSRVIDQGNSELKGRATVVGERSTKMSSQLTFFELSLGKIESDTQQEMLASDDLKPYRVWLRRRFEKARHDLSTETTNALKLVMPQATDAWETMVEELLSEKSAKVFTGKKVEEVAFNGLPSLLNSSDPRVVNEAGAAMTRIMGEVAPIAEREINAIITTKLRMNRLCKFERVDDSRFQYDDLDAEVAETMLSTVENNFDLVHRFYELKARLMGRDGFAYHQRAANYGTLPEGYTFEQASEMLRTVLTKLHPDFAKEFDRALQEGHIDVAPRKGKRGGAACWHSLIGHPTYLMLNFTGMLDGIQTTAHEFGHYLNNLHMQTGGLCNSLTFGATTPMAEVASTFFEQYILDHVLEGTDEETRLAILVSTLDDEVASMFRQSAAMRFEQELYARIEAEGYLSYQQIGELFKKHMSSYLGPSVSMEDGADLWWVYWGHFRYEFYVYGYSFAQLVAKALQTRVAEDPGYIDEFRRLLRTGMSMTSRDLLTSMGLNVSDESVWRMGIDQFKSTLDDAEELARKLGKI